VKDGAQIQKISSFTIKAENVVQINQGNDIVIFTEPNTNIDKVKVRNTDNKLIELGKIATHLYSLASLPTGVYSLDVIIDNRAYETILVILSRNQLPIVFNQAIITMINKIINRVEIDIENGGGSGGGNVNKTQGPDRDCFFAPDLPKCKPINGKCPDGFGFNDDDQCIPTGDCPSGYGRVDDDETGKCHDLDKTRPCEGGGRVLIGDRCWNEPPPLEEELPLCGQHTEGQRCRTTFGQICDGNPFTPECGEGEFIGGKPPPSEDRNCIATADVQAESCMSGRSVEDLCKEDPSKIGCDRVIPEPELEPVPITPEPEPIEPDVCMGLPPEECDGAPGAGGQPQPEPPVPIIPEPEPPLPDPGILPPPGEEEEEEEEDNEGSGSGAAAGGGGPGGEEDSGGDSEGGSEDDSGGDEGGGGGEEEVEE
jgi:hypothetical protein